jgi:hypothetical protein
MKNGVTGVTNRGNVVNARVSEVTPKLPSLLECVTSVTSNRMEEVWI